MSADLTGQRPAGRGRLGPVVAAGLTGVSGYLVLVIAARSLTPADNARFLVYWGTQYLVFGTLVGMTVEGTRSVFRSRAAHTSTVDPRAGQAAPRAGLVGIGAVVSTIVGALVLCTAVLWAPHVLGADWAPQVAILTVGAVFFGTQCAVAGVLVGRGDVGSYSTLVSFEFLTRLALVAMVAWLAPSVGSFAAAASLAAASWVLLSLVLPQVRGALAVRGDAATPAQVVQFLAAMGAALASALLVVGFPVLVALTATDREIATAAPLLLAVSLTRAPLMLPLSIYQNVLVTQVAARGWGTLLRPFLVIVAVTLGGAGLAALIGPWALELVQHGYRVSGGVLAGLVIAAGFTALVTITGAATVATGHLAAYVLGWSAAVAVAIGLLTLDLPLDHRVILALIAGPLTGAFLHVLSARRP